MTAASQLEEPTLGTGYASTQSGPVVVTLSDSAFRSERALAEAYLIDLRLQGDRLVVLVGSQSNTIEIVAIEAALQRQGQPYCRVDDSSADAKRLLTYLQHLAPAAVLGVTPALVNELITSGEEDLESVLGSVPVVAARPDMARAFGGTQTLLWVPFGPAIALQCRGAGNLHVSDRWSFEFPDGRPGLSGPVGDATRQWPLDVEATMGEGSCSCSIGGPYLRVVTP
jgi:hypothetical protein